jgi:hypothetical protein
MDASCGDAMAQAEMAVREARELLMSTAMAVGYPEPMARQLAEAALWLERIDARGVHSLLVYLILTQEISFNARKPARGVRYGLRCVCPIMAADIIVGKYVRQGLPEGVIGFEGPAAPALMAPQLVELARSRGRAVRLHAYNTKIVFGDTGFSFDGADFGHFPMVDAGGGDPVGVEFIPLVQFPAAPPLATIKMSNVRVQMDRVEKLRRRALAV